MNSSNNTIVIQTALRPMTIFGEEQLSVVADFQEFFDKMNILNISKDTKVFVNKGPGSYSGIRTGIAYVYGLLHAGLITKENIVSFTSFDLIHSISVYKTAPIYLKAWPRLANGLIKGSKGYFSDGKVFLHDEYEKFEDLENLIVFSEETLTDLTQVNVVNSVNASLLKESETYKKLIDLMTTNEDHSLEPLYINPVHINA